MNARDTLPMTEAEFGDGGLRVSPALLVAARFAEGQTPTLHEPFPVKVDTSTPLAR
ncbi:hypothetical protein Ade02nite_36760 [Paractinoplanes deccanensis]|uniref:Uncharacterized protein n=1 Tax=Paractinoplanes deccanensis TaxID=113561 RepID=A0ABQ3Y4Z8_9ACTN|nr:hypothetical protein Ade02nite_36760 [Actinoplanes deccanensis]